MWHRLAKALGKSVRQCQAEIDSREFASWIAYYNIEPFGDQWDDYRIGVLCASMRNAWRGEDSQPFKPSDFFWTLRDALPAAASVDDKIDLLMGRMMGNAGPGA